MKHGWAARLIVTAGLVALGLVLLSGCSSLVTDALTNDSTAVSTAVPTTETLAGSRKLTEPFTVAVLPDTQVYSEKGEPGFAKQVEWILANSAQMHIVFVSQLGDVVDNGTDEKQWANATEALRPLLEQDRLPFSIVRGNHDDPEVFLSHLPLSLMATKPWFVAASPSGLCQAQEFRVGRRLFLHVGFQNSPTASEIEWADQLLGQPRFRDVPVIVSTHDYLSRWGRTFAGWRMWNKFVRDHPMVFMVLSGHHHTEYALVSTDAAGRQVFQMVADYQDRDFGGNGLMRLITVDPAVNRIAVKTFSPYYQTRHGDGSVSVDRNYFETDADSQFVYPVDINDRLNIDKKPGTRLEPTS